MRKIKVIIPVLIAILLFFFPFHEVQVFSLIVLLTYLISFFLSILGRRSIVVTRDNKIYFCRNREEEYTAFRIKNRGFLSLENIFIQDMGHGCYDSGVGIFLSSISGRSEKIYKSRLNSDKRGVFKIGPIVIKGRDPLNFFPWILSFNIQAEVIIYPAYHNLKLILKDGERGGIQRVKDPQYEDMSELKAMREYRPGDSMKRVNWKASAKSGKLQTMEFSNTLSCPLFIIMDLNPLKYQIRNRYNNLERTIEAAASLAVSYGEVGESCGLLTGDLTGRIHIPLGKGYSHTVAILETLARISFLKSDGDNILEYFFQSKINIPGGSHVYILVPKLNKRLAVLLEILKKGKFTVKVILTGGGQSDVDFPGTFYTLIPYGKDFFI